MRVALGLAALLIILFVFTLAGGIVLTVLGFKIRKVIMKVFGFILLGCTVLLLILILFAFLIPGM